MSREPDPVERILADILDGRPVDWADAASTLPPDVAGLLEPLRVIATLAEHPSDGEPATATQARFTFAELIGRGAFGEVYRAWDARLQRDVAVKLVRRDRPFASSIIEEARRLARVHHPAVVTIHDVYEGDGCTGICMELIRGRTLDAIMRESGNFTLDAAAQIGVQLCRALAAIHRAGLIHRDVKTHNVMIDEHGRVVLMDFGAGSDASLGDDSRREGTPLYMAPEVLAGESARPESDLYSVGVLLYHLVTGAYPVGGRSLEEIRQAHTSGGVSRDVRLHLSQPLRGVVARALETQPERRFTSAEAMASALAARNRRPWLYLVALLVPVAALCSLPWYLARDLQSTIVTTTTRELAIPADLMAFGGLSPDASKMTYQTRSGGVGVVNLRTMETRELVPGGPGIGESLPSPHFRPDGRTIIFGWTPDGCRCGEIREVFHGGGTPRTLYRGASARFEQLFNVSSRELNVLVRETRGDSDELGVIALQTGQYEPLLPTPVNLGSATLSADGRFVVYDRPAAVANGANDLYIVDTNSKESRPLLTGAADDTLPIWQPDGRSVLFSSDRAGSPGLWRLDVREGRAVDPPVLVQRDMGRFAPLDQSERGTLLYWRSPILDIELVGFDAGRNVVVGSPRQPPVRVVGANASPDWSPDGESLIYVSERKVQGVSRSTLVIHALATGEERDMRVPVNGPLEPAWSPVGRTIVVRGPGSTDGRRGARLVDSTSGRITQVFPFSGVLSFQWARDGSAFFFTSPSAIQRADVATGRISPITLEGGWTAGRIALSPDNRLLAASASRGNRRGLLTFLAAGGSPRVLWEQSGDSGPPTTLWDWSPTGDALLVTRGPAERRELVAISVVDGSVHPTGLVRPGLAWVTVSPTGRQLTYGVGLNLRTLWVMEHFLPFDPDSQAR